MAELKHNISKFSDYTAACAADNLVAPHVSMIGSSIFYSKNIQYGKDVSFERIGAKTEIKEFKNYTITGNCDSKVSIQFIDPVTTSTVMGSGPINSKPREEVAFKLDITSGYQLKNLSCKTESGRALSLNSILVDGIRKYTFTMPFENCIIYATSEAEPSVLPLYTLTFDGIDPYRSYNDCAAIVGYVSVDGGKDFSEEKSTQVSALYNTDCGVIRTFGKTLVFINADKAHTDNDEYDTEVNMYYLGAKITLDKQTYDRCFDMSQDEGCFSVTDGCYSLSLSSEDISIESESQHPVDPNLIDNKIYLRGEYVGSLYFWRDYHMNVDETFTGFVLEIPEAETLDSFKVYDDSIFDLTFDATIYIGNHSYNFNNSFIIEPSLRPHITNICSYECVNCDTEGNYGERILNGFYIEALDYYVRENNLYSIDTLSERFNTDRVQYGRVNDPDYIGNYNKLIITESITGDARIDNIIREKTTLFIESGGIDVNKLADIINEEITVLANEYFDTHHGIEEYFSRYPNEFIDPNNKCFYDFASLIMNFDGETDKYGPANNMDFIIQEVIDGQTPKGEFIKELIGVGWDKDNNSNIFNFSGVDWDDQTFCKYRPIYISIGNISFDYNDELLRSFGYDISAFINPDGGEFNFAKYSVAGKTLPIMTPINY